MGQACNLMRATELSWFKWESTIWWRLFIHSASEHQFLSWEPPDEMPWGHRVMRWLCGMKRRTERVPLSRASCERGETCIFFVCVLSCEDSWIVIVDTCLLSRRPVQSLSNGKYEYICIYIGGVNLNLYLSLYFKHVIYCMYWHIMFREANTSVATSVRDGYIDGSHWRISISLSFFQ